jgi:hypothetical protein
MCANRPPWADALMPYAERVDRAMKTHAREPAMDRSRSGGWLDAIGRS